MGRNNIWRDTHKQRGWKTNEPS